MRIDAHQHFWRYSPDEYPWIGNEMSILKRDFLPANLEPLLAANKLDGSVAVQAQQTEAETAFLLELANDNPMIKGVVGWTELRAPDVDQKLEVLSQNPLLKGIRHVLQDEPDDEYMLHSDFKRGIRCLERHNLTYDILIYPRQLDAAAKLVKEFPNQPFVIDHLAKPHIMDGHIRDWQRQISALAVCDNVFCKISGMVTEADWQNWQTEDFTPYLEVIVEAFGTGRLLFGSDWPVCLLAAEYDSVKGIADGFFAAFTDTEKGKIFGGNAVRFYQL